MRPLLFYICCLGIVFLVSCEKDDPGPAPEDAVYAGNFVSSAHQTSGVASIDSTSATLTLTNFKTDTGPDLNIYLTPGTSNVTADFIDLGNIKGVDGTYNYDLPASIDFEVYKYVIVWCVAFDVNFGYAELTKQ